MKLLVSEIECKRKNIKYREDFTCPIRGVVPKHLEVDLKIKCVGSGDFSKYVTDENIDKHKLFTDIFFGKIKVKFGN